MEAAGEAPKAAQPCYDTHILGKGPNLSGIESPFARAVFGGTSPERLTPTFVTLPGSLTPLFETLQRALVNERLQTPVLP